MRGLPAAILRGEPVTTAWGLRLSSVFRVPFCPRPGFQKRLSTSIRVARRRFVGNASRKSTADKEIARHVSHIVKFASNLVKLLLLDTHQIHWRVPRSQSPHPS